MVESLQFFIFVISVFENTLKIFNALFYAKINAFSFLHASSGFFSRILTKKKKNANPHALATL
ncbi:hypothetical protein BV499_06075 [Helicobacter pylori]|nr:hypothetical protein BV499_06075 [Helicobacter pylori]